MKLRQFWAKGYRSLQEVTLNGLGNFNVFYGHNGSGKSNILAAIDALLGCVRVISTAHPWQIHASPQDRLQAGMQPVLINAGKLAFEEGYLSPGDFSVHAPQRTFSLGGIFCGEREEMLELGTFQEILVEVEVSEILPGQPRLLLKRLLLGEQDSREVTGNLVHLQERVQTLLFRLANDFSFVHADRSPRKEKGGEPPEARGMIRHWLRTGNIKRALFAASTSVDPVIRKRLRALGDLLAGPPLNRPRFDVVHDPITDEYDIREPLGNGDVAINQIGLGLAQAYAILAGVLLSDARMVAIEEPEAHLHAPTLGRDVRQLLERVVKGGSIDQLFVATHSNLFDLDPDGYWDVSLVNGETQVERKPLVEIDRLHLYEPGPAKRALVQLLKYSPDEEEVFRRPDGAPVTAREMLRLLQEDDPTALDFLRNLHGAALRIVRLDARRSGGKA